MEDSFLAIVIIFCSMEIRSLEQLHKGVDKHWVWKTKEDNYLANDCLRKIDYSVQELNKEIGADGFKSFKDVVYYISLTDWIIESLNTIQRCLRTDVVKGFVYDKNDEVRKACSYLKALRSFVVAHPLDTNKHENYGLDGNFICIDFRSKPTAIMKLINKSDRFYHLSIDGMEQFDISKHSDDVILLSYSKKKDGYQFFTYIGVNLDVIYSVSSKYIDKLYALDKYLGAIKKKDYLKDEQT